ncbi:hypothetical protein [Elizabethkingia anophelis]|uniref:hypothetical protein n=1 Tax=Elizabethkingia anophelis TaxID=1117645 RepID=UPI00293CD7D8|nr:hypothetical protein [Elizabethkingia anophelis]
MSNSLVFPELIGFSDFHGDFTLYFDAVYKVFHKSFIESQPLFRGLKVSAQKHPEVDGIHRTFYHITHEGEIENERTPDFRRMERIRFPKFCIESLPHDELLIWEKTIGKDNRIHILNEEEKYLVVLTERNGYYLFWTAFYIEENHTVRKKKKEYENYIKAKTA